MTSMNRPSSSRQEPVITDDSPIRLDVAAALAFPDGTMKVAGLRREAARGRLAITRIAGKDYTTLAAIRDMIEKCRVQPKEPASGSAPPVGEKTGPSVTPRAGSSSTAGSNIPLDAALKIVEELSKPSPPTSRGNTKRRGATVTYLPSQSPTS